MKNITTLNPLNLRPTIVLDHEGLEAIKHIVSIAPQEAQWFNTVEAIQYQNCPGEIFLYLSTKLYIPKQNTSAAQVDSNSTMMMEFYNELKDQHTLQETNDILSSMTCWSHSHHNMTPHPSAQDENQFQEFIKMSIDQNLKKWQVMLIFNKRNEFYSRVYNPDTGLILEGVDLIVNDNYDFSYIDQAAKTKFLKPKPKKIKNNKSFWNSKNPGYTSTNWLFEDSQTSLSYDTTSDDLYYMPIAEGVLEGFKSKNIKFTKNNIEKFITSIGQDFTDKECFLLLNMIAGDNKKVLDAWEHPDFLFDDMTLTIEAFKEEMTNKTRTKSSLLNKITFFLELLDLPFKTVQSKIKEAA